MSKNEKKYMRLYEALRDEIVKGVWPYGAKLPSRRQLAAERGLSVVTVDHCYDLLCQEGYIEPRPRSGCYVRYRAADGFAHAEAAPVAHRPTPSAEKATFPFSVLARTMRRALSDYGEAILTRPDNAGFSGLRESLSRYLGRNRGMTVSSDQIIIGAGAEYLYGLIVEILGRENVWGLESPSYEKIEQVYRGKGVKYELLPLGSDGVASEALWASGANVLHITPFRSFPTGVTASASKRAEYIRWADAGGRYIVEDDFESEFSLLRKPEATVFSLSERGNVIYMNTFSRTISPALRVGYMVLPSSLMSAYERRAGFYSCPVPAFEQYVLQALLDSGDFERHINRIRRQMRKG